MLSIMVEIEFAMCTRKTHIIVEIICKFNKIILHYVFLIVYEKKILGF